MSHIADSSVQKKRRGPQPGRSPVRAPWVLIWSTCLGGCSGSPSRNILGSYFPSWMVCALVGLAMALLARVALKYTGLLGELPAPLLVLLSIGCATTFALWLVWLS